MRLLRIVWLLLFSAHRQPVGSEVAVRVTLQSADGPCQGFVEAHYNKMVGHVGDQRWNNKTEEVVCRSTHCGTPIYNATVDVPMVHNTALLNQLECTGEEKDLLECHSPGVGVSFYNKPTVKRMQCSHNITFSLVGFRCSGAVQYSTNGKQPSGYLCGDNWNTMEARWLCQKLNCGDVVDTPVLDWVEEKDFSLSSKMEINCSGIQNVTHLWQCATPKPWCSNPARVMCQKHKRLQIEGSTSNACSGKLKKRKDKKWVDENTTNPHLSCQQMHCGSYGYLTQDKENLTCSDNVSVVLRSHSQETKCYGQVNIRVNGSVSPVCGNKWEPKEDKLVCTELGCGEVVHSSFTRTVAFGIMDYVQCDNGESSLWQCQARRGESRCEKIPFVVCSKSVEVKLVDGPGKCAGRLEVRHAGQWKRVLQEAWTGDDSAAVCQQLGCGEKSKEHTTKQYSQGSGSLVRVKCSMSNKKTISECNISDVLDQKDDALVVEITCQGHKVLFLNGSQACSGEVGINHAAGTHWLSGSSATWNKESADAVCQQMHCGEASKFWRKPSDSMTVDAIWGEAYNCLPANRDLFDCANITQPSDHSRSIALVTCSGRTNVTLSNGCWGRVEVCSNGVCGGVCGDAWTKEKSEMLCENLGCGNKVLDAHTPPRTGRVMYKSLHTTEHTHNLSQCNLVKSQENDNSCDLKPAYVVCSGSLKPRFQESGDYCSGNVVVDYEGQTLPVCNATLKDTTTREAICRQLSCGHAQNTKVLPYVGHVPNGASLRITALQCSSTNGTGSGLNCDAKAKMDTCEFGGLQCSDWKKMSFKDTCRGEVVVHNKDGMHSVSVDGWGNKEGGRLCEDMKCGKFESQLGPALEQNKALSFWTGNFSCGDGAAANIWGCETPTALVQKKKLSLQCKDPPKVSLSQQCYGELRINGMAVCRRNWLFRYSQMVCQQLNCGNPLPGESEATSTAISRTNPKTYHVHCEDYNYELGQCKRVQGPCDGNNVVSVSCVDSLKFNTTQHCGGVLQVQYKANWENVSMQAPPSSETQNKICKALKCVRHNASVQPANKRNPVNLAFSLDCTEEIFDAKYCVKKTPPSPHAPAEIYCDGYVAPSPDKANNRVLLAIIFGAIFLVILLIGILTFVGLRMMKKLKKPGIFARKLSSQKGEVESGSYTEVAPRENDLDSVHEGRFPSDAEIFSENDMQSTSSLPYDDVETQPLTDGTGAVSGPADRLPATDEVTYEVDDPQENYDDVGDIQTQAEVYDKPSARPESLALPPPPEPEQEDGDYLVPGEDG